MPVTAAMAAAEPRCWRPPRASPSSPGAPPRSPLPPRQRNRPWVPSVAADVADSPRRTRASAAKICRHQPTSGLVDLPGELTVSPWSGWTSSRPSSWPEPPPESRPALCSPWPSCPAPGQRGLPAGGPRARAVSCLGSFWPGCKKSL
jgi:hypothetical protein